MRLAAHDLNLFAIIVDHGGISGAARKLGMPKSSVSRQLAAIEATVGTRLLQRTTRAVSLTEAGEVLLGFARRVIEELENADAAIAELDESPRGHLAVTAPYAIVRFALAPRLGAFLAAHPDLSISLTPSIEILDLVENRIDVALRIGELPSSGHIARKLASVPLILVASPGYLAGRGAVTTPAALASHDIVALGSRAQPMTLMLSDQDGARAEVGVCPRVAIGEPAVVIDLVMRGLGIGIAPQVYAVQAIASGALVHVLPDWRCGEKPVHALYPSRKLLPRKVRAFVDFAAECFADDSVAGL